LSISFEEILLRVYGDFEEENKVLESSIITIHYWIIVNAFYNYTVQLMHSIIITFLIKTYSSNAIRKKM
jgi:hypothetical protein